MVVGCCERFQLCYSGLLSGHILAEYLRQRAGILRWYRGELLEMARDLGYRLLPAFNTTTGIPHARVSLFDSLVLNNRTYLSAANSVDGLEFKSGLLTMAVVTAVEDRFCSVLLLELH